MASPTFFFFQILYYGHQCAPTTIYTIQSTHCAASRSLSSDRRARVGEKQIYRVMVQGPYRTLYAWWWVNFIERIIINNNNHSDITTLARSKKYDSHFFSNHMRVRTTKEIWLIFNRTKWMRRAYALVRNDH